MGLKTFKFNSPIPPSVNKYLDKRVEYKGRNYKELGFRRSKETLIYENHMRNTFHKLKRQVGWETPDKDKFFEIYLTYYLDSKAKDPDNCLKLLFDEMVRNGIIPTDSQIIFKMRDLYIDSINPRIEVELNIMDKIGVFKDEAQLKEFEMKNCHKCKKHYYKKPCGNLKKYKENYITKDLDLENMACKNIKEIGSKNV